ncbi:GNAT family N-acetyltransferase [Siccibacter colletis]|uniref:GNAT family N-acetyltransferase n=1 Tax=Siccibacter colletis TaxID=1505757 RepID=A0ABY6JDP4_9ENTR|nr:GNAT family N-acetyltransferase [Siccibacter colletis]UYU31598.1 GNAT family N-acetyltransferase [Siccibacter colletis]
MPGLKIEILAEGCCYDTTAFDCGDATLNTFLTEHLQRQHSRRVLRAYILRTTDEAARVRGFYTLSGSCFEKAQLPSRTQQKKMPYRNVPAVTLGRLAIDQKLQGEGWGSTLVSHAMKVVYQASLTVGIHGMFVDALNEKARRFYLSLGFIPLTGDNHQALFYPVTAMEALFAEHN